METRHVEEQAKIILEHLRSEQVDPNFIVRHAEALLGFAVSAETARTSRQLRVDTRIPSFAAN